MSDELKMGSLGDHDDEIQPVKRNSVLDGGGGDTETQLFGSQFSLPPVPGSIRRNFTSVRAAALRASGLAARNMAFKGTNNEPCSIKGDDQSLKQHTAEDNGMTDIRDSLAFGKEIDEDFPREYNEQMKGLKNQNKCRVGSSTVRRLFADDTLAEIEGLNNYTNNAGGGVDLPQLTDCGNEMAGLSYVDSQEPGELSQANALDFVDRFLKFNDMDFGKKVDIVRSTGGKVKPISSAKGTQSLAKRTNFKSTAGGRGIFDWDDNREDEGGGEFFTKKKEAFFDNGRQRHRSLTQPRKLKHLDSKGTGAVDETRDKEERLEIHRKTKDLANSDSRLVLHNSKRNYKTVKLTEAKSKKDLTKEMDEQLKIGSSDGIEATGSDMDTSEMLNVGVDTQMAAEAMQELCFGLDVADHDNKDTNQGTKNTCEGSSRGEEQNRSWSKKYSRQKRSSLSGSRVLTRNSKQTKIIGTKLSGEPTLSSLKQAKNVRKESDIELVAKPKKAKSNDGVHLTTNLIENADKVSPEVNEQIKEVRAPKRSNIDEVGRCLANASSSGRISVKKRRLEEQGGFCTPIACRTRQQHRVKYKLRAGIASYDSREGKHLNDRRQEGITEKEKSHQKLIDTIAAVRIGELRNNRGRRTQRKLSGPLNGSCNLHKSINQFVGKETNGQSLGKSNKSKTNAVSPSMDLGMKRKTKRRQSDADTMSAGEHAGGNARLEVSPGDRCKPSGPASTTPVNCTTPINAASPICMGADYLKQSCRKNLSKSFLIKEINSLISKGPEPISPTKDSRRRRDMANVCVLFSHHLDDDLIKQQKKILARLGASVAPSISEATHFVTDKFVRTRNMLEAIAFGKPVVTRSWLESCRQASCFIDERNYILRDAKKEKEFGFSLPVSLARACQHPLLQGLKVLITPNTKPGKEILVSLVKAVHGLAVERIGRSAFKDDKISEGLLVLSCEEDYAICVPFLEKGAAVYSSELLLNGIVIQKLEYERHRLFVDHVRRTRSTVRLKQDSNHYLPVTNHK
ncbi:uncharacterized protein LOC114309237 isoform X2 [Camellia sinensis]|uniref:uncharacterized protein LOC114309237 isoform X2 n=1 Tax=Camellia sinensis TaxID=4442 RepID=UPI001036CAA3|nr:uncharacterized protein LOC114309237 isoform X2 [Camellia sinensis]